MCYHATLTATTVIVTNDMHGPQVNPHHPPMYRRHTSMCMTHGSICTSLSWEHRVYNNRYNCSGTLTCKNQRCRAGYQSN